jgi:hypothetical protein
MVSTILAGLALAAQAEPAPLPAAFPPIAASWHIGGPVAPDHPTRFDLGPRGSNAPTIAWSRILPTVLVELTETAPSPLAPSVTYAAGTQLFQLERRSRPTFCTFGPQHRSRWHCFIDSDSDGRLDSVAPARHILIAPPVLGLEQAAAVPLAAPLPIRALPREAATEKLAIGLFYIGRRRMTRRDATFMLSITNGRGDFSEGARFPLYLDTLPTEAEMGGVRLTDIQRRENHIVFNVASGFPEGPFTPGIGRPRGIEWGF